MRHVFRLPLYFCKTIGLEMLLFMSKVLFLMLWILSGLYGASWGPIRHVTSRDVLVHDRNPMRRNRNVHDNLRQELPRVQVNNMNKQETNDEFSVLFSCIVKCLIDHDSRMFMAPMNPRLGKEVTTVRDFIWMNLLELHGSKIEDNPQEFNDEIYKMLMVIGVTAIENKESATYQLNCVSYVWFN